MKEGHSGNVFIGRLSRADNDCNLPEIQRQSDNPRYTLICSINE